MVQSVCSFQPYNLTRMIQNSPQCSTMTVQDRFGLVLSQSLKDGNCFYTSVSTNILNDPDIWKAQLRLLGIMDISSILPTQHRQVFVSELTGQRERHYKDFTTDVDYSEEAKKYLNDGYYDSQLGNLMPLAMAEALESNFILFRTDDVQPLFVTPQCVSIHRTIFLVYDPQGSGHYDAALTYQSTHALPKSKPIKCSCGVNRKEASHSCCKQVHYASRCICLKAGNPCTDFCRCNNPN